MSGLGIWLLYCVVFLFEGVKKYSLDFGKVEEGLGKVKEGLGAVRKVA